MQQKPFTMIFQPGENNELLVTLFQRPYPASRNGKVIPAIPRGELHGLALLVIWDTLLEVMRVEQARAPILPVPSKTRRGLSEGSGIRLSVLFQALNPLVDPANLDQLRLLHQEFSTLSLEETYYWFAQIHAKGKRGIYSLQLLLGLELNDLV